MLNISPSIIDVILIVLAALYVIPIIRICFFFVPPIDAAPLRSFGAVFGRLEWAVHPLRDSVLLAALVAALSYGLYIGVLFPTLYLAPFILLSAFCWMRYLLHRRRMTLFCRNNPNAHPKDVFACYYSGFGFIPVRLPKKAKRTVDVANCDFIGGETPSKKLMPVIFGSVDTAILARLVTTAFKWKGSSYARETAKSIGVIWGLRAAQLGRLSVRTEGLEKLEGLNGKMIFAMTHKSYLDFALGTIALPPRYSIKYLAARDHFVENPLYRFLIGGAMEVVGTIFVDRKGHEQSAVHSAHEAVEKLSSLNISIAVFPQGTRAYGNVSASGKRLDSGYYTAGTPKSLVKTGGHLKRGTAFIATDTAIAMKDIEKSAVHVVPIAIIGTGLAAPKHSLKIQTGTKIVIKIGDPITINGTSVKVLKVGTPEHAAYVENIHIQLDNSFKGLLDTHAILEQRFFKDIRGLLPSTECEHVSVAMKAWRGTDYLIHTLLDCIYATAPAHWPDLLREITYLLTSDAPHPTLLHFKARVVDLMVEGR